MEGIHIFEAAGLGKAPFSFDGIQTDQDRADIENDRMRDGKPYTTNHCTSCDYCSQAIHNAYFVRSADGKRFKVGCDCIRKADDSGLIRYVTKEESRKRSERAEAKRKAARQRELQLVAMFKSGQFSDQLRAMPHPKGREGCTAFDYVDWCVDAHCVGTTVVRLLESVATGGD